MEQLADIYAELHRYPLEKMGCLTEPDRAQIGRFARESLADFKDGTLLSLGPYSTLEDYHTASIQHILDLILREELYTDRKVDAYLIHLVVKDLVPRVTPEGQNEGPFFLKHPDDKGDHLLVDEDGNITGIIDWEWAHTAPAALAFNSPLVLLPVAEFYDGKNNLGEQEVEFAHILDHKGHTELASAVRGGRMQHRFAFCCGYDLADWDGFVGLFKGFRDIVDVDAGLNWDEWKVIALDRYRADKGLGKLIAEE